MADVVAVTRSLEQTFLKHQEQLCFSQIFTGIYSGGLFNWNIQRKRNLGNRFLKTLKNFISRQHHHLRNENACSQRYVDTVIVMSSRALRTLASMGSRKLRDFESRGASTGGCFYTLMTCWIVCWTCPPPRYGQYAINT